MNDGKFFECSIPLTAPVHIASRESRSAFETAAMKITERHRKLQHALELCRERSSMTPETFQVITSKLFKDEEKRYGNVDHFDSLTECELADYALMLMVENESYERLVWPNAEIICDAAFATNDEWANSLRQLGIGGSESAAVRGISPYTTAKKIYHAKRGDPVLAKDDSGEKVFARGHYLEDEVIASFCRRTGAVRIRDTRMFRSRKYPHCIADIDAILRFPDGKIYPFEAKTTVLDNRDAWKDGKIPAHYVTQTRHYAGVLDDDRISGVYIGCHFTVDMEMCGDYAGSLYNEMKFLSRIVDRAEDLEDEVLRADEEFWKAHIECGKEPEYSGKSALDMEVLKAYSGYADPSAPHVEFGRDRLKSVEEYLRLSDEISRLESRKKVITEQRDRIKVELADTLGTSVSGKLELPDGTYYEVSYKPVAKQVTDTATLEACFPEAYRQCVTENPEAYRMFTVKHKDEKGRTVKKKAA